MSKKKKKQNPAFGSHPGYRQFMSGFSEYARENNIHIHGGRGSFAKAASKAWKDLKGKPAWADNLDVILPQYVQEYEGAKPLDLKIRAREIAEQFGADQYEWWNIKMLYGLWVESVHVNTHTDHLLILNDEDDSLMDISTDSAAYDLYNMFRDLKESNVIDPYSYLKFNNVEENEEHGIDLYFLLVGSTEFSKHLHGKTSFQWREQLREKYQAQKEAIGKKGVARLAKTKLNISKESKEEAKKEDISVTKASIERLEELNKAVDKLENQYQKGLITKAQYRKYLNRLYKL